MALSFKLAEAFVEFRTNLLGGTLDRELSHGKAKVASTATAMSASLANVTRQTDQLSKSMLRIPGLGRKANIALSLANQGGNALGLGGMMSGLGPAGMALGGVTVAAGAFVGALTVTSAAVKSFSEQLSQNSVALRNGSLSVEMFAAKVAATLPVISGMVDAFTAASNAYIDMGGQEGNKSVENAGKWMAFGAMMLGGPAGHAAVKVAKDAHDENVNERLKRAEQRVRDWRSGLLTESQISKDPFQAERNRLKQRWEAERKMLEGDQGELSRLGSNWTLEDQQGQSDAGYRAQLADINRREAKAKAEAAAQAKAEQAKASKLAWDKNPFNLALQSVAESIKESASVNLPKAGEWLNAFGMNDIKPPEPIEVAPLIAKFGDIAGKANELRAAIANSQTKAKETADEKRFREETAKREEAQAKLLKEGNELAQKTVTAIVKLGNSTLRFSGL